MNRNKEPYRALMYARLVPEIQKLGKMFGYAIAVHGSQSTDLDLIAVPWIPEAKAAEDLVEAIRLYVDGRLTGNPSNKPHGRRAWSIYDKSNVGGGDDPYIDISVVPRLSDLEQLAKVN